ncbi:MAG: tetratricopeptide repeat protein [Dissulfuribacterales bacterium]
MTEKITNIPPHKLRPIHTALLIAIMLFLGAMVYSNTFNSPFLFDDDGFIVNDYAIRMTELSRDSIKTAGLQGFPAHRYLPNISWAVNYYFGRLNPFGYHLVNLIIHLLTGIFLFFFIKTTLRASIKNPEALIIVSTQCNRGGGVYPRPNREGIKPSPTTDETMIDACADKINPDVIAFFAAMIWIVQPVGTQAVTYICQRMTSMVALFYILSLLLYVRGRMALRQAPSDWRKPCLYFSGCLFSAICAIATKENAGTLPLVILLYEWFFFQDLKLDWSRRQILWIAFFGIVFAGVVFWFLGENPLLRIMNSYNRRNFTLIERVMTEWRIMVYYISLFAWAPPGRLNLDHDYPLSLSSVNPDTTMITLAAILALFALAAYSAKKERLIAFGILWFFITQATESTIIGIELIFEHRTYIPFMMISLMFVLVVFRAFHRLQGGLDSRSSRRGRVDPVFLSCRGGVHPRPQQSGVDPVSFPGPDREGVNPSPTAAHPNGSHPHSVFNKTSSCILLCAVTILFSIWTYQRNQIWQNPVSFWSDTLFKSADKPRAYKNLAFAYQQKKEWVLAVFYYKKALNIDEKANPPDFATYANLGAALIKQNQFFDAVYYYSKAIEQKKAVADVLQPLAFALTRIGELDAAKNYYHLALKIHPNNESTKKELADLTAFLNRFTDPNVQIKQLLAEAPDDPALMLKQGDLFDRQGLPAKAIAAYRTALAYTDDNDELLRRAILPRLATAYAVSQRFEDALAVYRRLIGITPDNAMLYYNAAAVYAVEGKISKAKTFLKKAADRGLNVTKKIKTDPNFKKIRP